jgi:hypothetical protein
VPGYTVVNKLKCQGSVLDIKTLGKEIAVFDSSYCLLRADRDTLRPTAKGAIQKGMEPMYPYAKSASICKTADMLMSVGGGSKAYMLSMKDGALAKKGVVEYLKGNLLVSAFSTNGELCMCGSDKGELALFDAKRLIPLGAFDNQGDYVSQISFCGQDRFCAVSYYDKRTIIYDILEMKIVCVFNSEAIVEKAVFAKKINAFINVSRDGTIEAVCGTRKKAIFTDNTTDFWATDVVLVNENTIAVSSRDGRLFFFDIEEEKIIKEIIPISNVGISKLYTEDDRLFVGFCSGDVFAIQMNEHKDEFEACVKLGDFVAAEALCGKNFFLGFEVEYKEALKKAWEIKKNEIVHLLVKQRPQEAYTEVKPFLRIPSIKAEFEEMVSQSADVAQFFDALEGNDYTQAYKTAFQSGIIQKLEAFEKLENIFGDSLKTAISLLEDDAFRNKATVMNLLKPFAAVPSKKETVIDLVKNWGKYKESLSFLKNRAFKDVFILAAKYPFLKDTAVYKKSVALGEGLFQKLNLLESAGEYQKSLDICKLLLEFAPFASVASAKIPEFTAKIKLSEAIDDYKQKKITAVNISHIVNKNGFLEGCDILDELLSFMQSEIMNLHSEYGQTPEEFWSRTKEYAYITKLKNFTLTLLRESYLAELKRFSSVEPLNIEWRQTFEKFAMYFEIDAKTESFARSMGVEVSIKERAKDINIDMLPDSIAVKKN